MTNSSKAKLVLTIFFAAFFLLGFSSNARAENCPGTCRNVCNSDERTMAWFGGMRFDNCSWYQGCCVKDASGGDCPGTCRLACNADEYHVGWALPGLNYNNCKWNEGCCMRSTPIASQQTPQPTQTRTPDNTTSGLVPCTNNCTLCHLVIGFKRVFNYLIGLLFVATMLAITVCGVFYMVSSGSKGVIEMAKKGLTYSLMAFAIGMGGWLLINTVMIGLGFQHPYGGNWWEFTCDTTPGQGPVASGTAPNWNAGSAFTGKGCEGVAQNAMAMNGWSYTQGAERMTNGFSDCSSMVFRSYQAAGCNLPQNDSRGYAAMSKGIGDPSSLKVGDVVAYPGHVVVCLDNGCNRVMSANGRDGVFQSNGSSYYGRSDAGVLRASEYCPDC